MATRTGDLIHALALPPDEEHSLESHVGQGSREPVYNSDQSRV
jgi:hypothetical protein